MRRPLVFFIGLVVSLVLQSAALAQSTENDLAGKQWLAFYDYRRASQTETCTILSREAPFGVLLLERTGKQLQLIEFGQGVSPGSEAWVRIDEGESRRFIAGIIPTDESFPVISDMLLGAYAYIEWSELSHGIKETQTGLGFFAWTYALCRAKLGWPIPDGLRSILSHRYEDGPDLESPELPSSEAAFEKLQDELEHYLKRLEDLRSSIGGS